MKPTLIALLMSLCLAGCVITPTVESVTGTYEYEVFGKGKIVFLENGMWEDYQLTKWNLFGPDIIPDKPVKRDSGKWVIESGRVLVTAENGNTVIIKRKWNGDLKAIAFIIDGKRHEAPKEKWTTLKKIK